MSLSFSRSLYPLQKEPTALTVLTQESSTEDVSQFLLASNLRHLRALFVSHRINGQAFAELTDKQLRQDLHVHSIGERNLILQQARKLKKRETTVVEALHQIKELRHEMTQREEKREKKHSVSHERTALLHEKLDALAQFVAAIKPIPAQHGIMHPHAHAHAHHSHTRHPSDSPEPAHPLAITIDPTSPEHHYRAYNLHRTSRAQAHVSPPVSHSHSSRSPSYGRSAPHMNPIPAPAASHSQLNLDPAIGWEPDIPSLPLGHHFSTSPSRGMGGSATPSLSRANLNPRGLAQPHNYVEELLNRWSNSKADEGAFWSQSIGLVNGQQLS